MGEKFLEFLSKKKTLLFLIMCLMVHAFNAVLFYCIGLTPYFILNVFSTIFYAVVLLSFQKNHDVYIIFSYIEIISFSLISSLFNGGAFFYIFYVVGMISVVAYLLPPKKRMKHIFQGIGILYAVAIFIVFMKNICLFPEYDPIVREWSNRIGCMNLFITLFTLFYISNLYIFELNSASEKLNYVSNHDLLTGLFNRRFFEHIMERNKNENENEYTIAIFDIDNFKKFNDTYGHQAGDCILKVVSKLIEESCENEYVPVRWGGEEFILYMPQTSADQAFEQLNKIIETIRTTSVEFENKIMNVTVTVGMCTGSDLKDYEDVIRRADSLLYYGKRNGKNCVFR